MRLLPIAVLAPAVLAVPAQAADLVLGQVPRPIRLSALAGTLAYSRLDESGMWHLVLWENGVARDAPVAAKATPFDVDLGRGPSGDTLAAYSRPYGALQVLDTVTRVQGKLAF